MISELFKSDYKGNLGIAHLPRLYSKIKQDLNGKEKEKFEKNEWTQDLIILDALNLGTLEPFEFICENNASLDEFENWVLEKNGGTIEKTVIEKINRAILSDDRVSINPPETDSFKYNGSDLHWDVSLNTPMPFGLHSLDVKYISAKAGDFIIWDDRLPHGASPNRDTKPRIVQYINFYSPKKSYSDNWK